MSPPSNDPRIIAGFAAKMMEAMYQLGGVYTRCGVLLEALLPQGAGQGDVFAVQDPRAPGLLAAMDGLNLGSGVGPSGPQRRGSGRVRYEVEPEKPGMDDTLGGDPGRPLGRNRARQKRKSPKPLPLLQWIILVMIGDSAESSTPIPITEPSVSMSQVCAFC
jgi:hypothetical protein